MRARSWRRHVFTAAVIPLIVLVGLRSAWASYLCLMDGAVRDTCCCPTGPERDAEALDDDERPYPTPQIAAAGCCAVSVHETPPTLDATASERMLARQPAVLVVEVVPPLPPEPTVVLMAPLDERAARPPPRVPIFLDNHAILR